MLTYQSISDVLAAAQAAGSTATTVRGAIKFLASRLGRIRQSPAVREYASLTGHWSRNAEAAADYRYTRRGERICAGLGLPTDYEERVSALRRAAAYAEQHGAPAIPARLIGQLLSRHAWPADTIERYALDRVGLRRGVRLAMDEAARTAAAALADNWPLKRAESRWAGGDHSVSVAWTLDPARVTASGDSTRVWSDNGKWSGHDSSVSLTVTVRALVKFPTLRTPDGQIILDYEPIPDRPRVARIVWVEQGRGFAVHPVRGYLIRGYHVEATSLDRAERRVREIRRSACAKMLAARTQRRQDRQEYGHVWVGVADSIAGGNCPSGTEAYRQQLCREVGGEIGGVRADWLLARRRDTYTLRAVRAALVRSGHPLAEIAG
jgi:hypothetical protein